MKNLLPIAILMLGFLSAYSQKTNLPKSKNFNSFKKELKYYRGLNIPYYSEQDLKEIEELRVLKEEYVDSLKTAFVLKPGDGEFVSPNKVNIYLKSCDDFKAYKLDVRHDDPKRRDVSFSDSFYFGIETIEEMIRKYVSYNSNSIKIIGVGMRLYRNEKIRNGKPSHSDIVLFPVGENGEHIYKTDIDGNVDIIDSLSIKILKAAPPYNSSTPCPTC